MALKALLLRRSIDSKNELMKQLMEKDESFRTREAELETAIMEAATDDDRAAVDQEVEKFEAEKSAHEDEKQRLAQEIEGLEADLEKLEEETPAPAARSNPPKERKDSMNLQNLFSFSFPFFARIIKHIFQSRSGRPGGCNPALRFLDRRKQSCTLFFIFYFIRKKRTKRTTFIFLKEICYVSFAQNRLCFRPLLERQYFASSYRLHTA